MLFEPFFKVFNADEYQYDPLRSAHTRELVPATSPLKSLLEGTVRRNLSHELFTRSVLRNESQGLVPKVQTFEFVGLVPGTKV